jgi:hypothetical protein
LEPAKPNPLIPLTLNYIGLAVLSLFVCWFKDYVYGSVRV